MKLYGYWTSNPQKVRLALEEMGEPYEYVNLDLSQRAGKDPNSRTRTAHPFPPKPVGLSEDYSSNNHKASF